MTSPDEVYWETAGLGKFFIKPDLNAVIAKGRLPVRSGLSECQLYVEAGLLQLLDRRI